jgi:signal peptidase II
MPSLPLENLKNPAAAARFFGTCAVGLAIDLWTKHWAVGRLKFTGDVIEFIPGWLHWEYTENHGAVFGLGQGQTNFFLAVSFFAILLLTWMFATAGKKWFAQVVLGMLLAGVLGNMYDRITVGYVRDMIHALPQWHNPLSRWFPSWQYVFPWIFNVADVMLCVGVGLTLILGLFQKPEPEEKSVDARSPQADRKA